MPKFIYRAKKDPLQTIEDTIIAENRISAISKLSSQGYFLLSIDEYLKSEESSYKQGGISRRRISLKDITNFTRQFSDLLEGGLTVVKALEILQHQAQNKRLKEVIADIRDFCLDGKSLSEGLAKHPEIFSHLFVSMVRSGESAGALENILKRLTDFFEQQFEIQTKLRSSLAYPALMAIVGSITIIVLISYVIPKIAVMFKDLGQNLPLPTLILMAASDIARSYWWLILAGVCAVIFFFLRLSKTKKGRLALDGFKLSLHVFGNLIKKIELARFSRTLATLLNNGVPVLESLKVVS